MPLAWLNAMKNGISKQASYQETKFYRSAHSATCHHLIVQHWHHVPFKNLVSSSIVQIGSSGVASDKRQAAGGYTLVSRILEHIEISGHLTKFAEKLIVEHLFYTISIATNKITHNTRFLLRKYSNAFDYLGHRSMVHELGTFHHSRPNLYENIELIKCVWTATESQR